MPSLRAQSQFKMINGTILLERGWPSGPLIGQALVLAHSLTASGTSEADVLATLARIHDDPASVLDGQPGFALAQTAETTYADLVRQRVLGPLGMEETFETVPDALASRFVGGHGADGQPVPHWTWTEPTAGAGMWRSSVSDLLTLAEAAIDPSSTDLADALALSLQPHAEIGAGQEMGLGWHLAPTPFGALAWHPL